MEYDKKEINSNLFDGKASGTSPDASYALKKSNLFYVGKFLFIAILCFILYNTGSSWLGKLTDLLEDNNGNKLSVGVKLVARLTLSLAIWYLIHTFMTLGNKNLNDSCQFMAHTQFLWLHSLILFGIWVGCWFIPAGFIEGYIKIAKYISWIYLLLQIFFLVDFFHGLNEKYVTEENTKCFLVITAILTIGFLTGFGLAYYFFGGCGGNIAIITVNLVICILLYITAIFTERGSIFTASIVSCYVVYLTSAGLMVANDGCSRVSQAVTGKLYTVGASIFTLVWMAYSAFSATYQINACDCRGVCCDDEREFDSGPEFNIPFFHFVFALASVYLLMIVTHWGYTGSTESISWALDRGATSKWVNISASWVTLIIYALSLIAPLICPDRDFD
jgi:hypothetical protein